MTARKTPMKRIALTNSSYRMGFTTSALPPNRSLSSSEEVNTTTGIIFKLSLACRAEGFAKAGVSLPQEFETVHQGHLQVQQNQDRLARPKALRRPAAGPRADETYLGTTKNQAPRPHRSNASVKAGRARHSVRAVVPSHQSART